MKRSIIGRLVIVVLLLLASVVMTFAEIGVATAFDMKFNGLSYLDYAKEFYAIPWHQTLGIAILVVFFIVMTEIIYADWTKMKGH